MCTITTIKFACGHAYVTGKKPCKARPEQARSCFAMIAAWFTKCSLKRERKRSSRLCPRCAASADVQSSGRLFEDFEMERSMAGQRVHQDRSTSREPERMGRSTDRTEEVREERGASAEPWRSEWLDAQGVKRSPATRTRDRGSHRAGRSSRRHPRSQRQADIEREMRFSGRPVPTDAEVEAAEANVVESQGINWNTRISRSRSSAQRNLHPLTTTNGFSQQAYNNYWHGVREERPISPLTQEDLDYTRYPVVDIPVHDEYPNYR